MLKNLTIRISLVFVGIITIISGCSQPISTQTPITIVSAEAYWPTQDWHTTSPEEQGMDSMILAAMIKSIEDEGYAIDSISVVRNGYMVLDAVVHPFRKDTKHIIHSCTKSIVSALIGIAIEQGSIDSVSTRVLDLFPGREVSNIDANKEAMTLQNLLTMTTGFECRDSYLYRWRGLDQMRASADWVQFILDLPMSEAPGTTFEYCNSASFLLSAIITEKTGMSSLEYAEEYLFGALGITDVIWPANPQGINIGWGELRMLPHDMAKIGYLYLQRGQWDGQQIVPADWIEDSTRSYIPATLEDGYGYQWWIDDSGLYLALGYAGQFIFVMPERDLVVVFTSDLNEEDFYIPQVLMRDFIIPAATSPMPIPANPAAESLLYENIESLSSP